MISQPAMVGPLLARFDVKHSSTIPVSPIAKLGPMADDDIVTDHSFRQMVGSVMWLLGMTRPDVADAARAMARH